MMGKGGVHRYKVGGVYGKVYKNKKNGQQGSID